MRHSQYLAISRRVFVRSLAIYDTQYLAISRRVFVRSLAIYETESVSSYF